MFATEFMAAVLAVSTVLAAGVAAEQTPHLIEIDSPVTRDGGSSRGVAWGDFDNDGDADLAISNTDNQLLFLYRNAGGGQFERVTRAPFDSFRAHGEGISWVDFDNDGWLDLFVVRTDGPNALFRNQNGTFRKFDAGDLTADNTVSSEGCWADYDNDGWLDVFIVNRNDQDDVLYRNMKGRSFQRIQGPFTGRGGDARTCAAGDANGDGRPDIYVGNFLRQMEPRPLKAVNFFYLNQGKLRFREIIRGHFVNTPSLTYGASFVDFDQDGDLDLFITNISLSDRNLLYENLGDGNFYPREDLALSKDGLGPSKGHSWGDIDNDGDLDILIAEGTENITDEERALGYNVHNRLFLNDGKGNFKSIRDSAFTTNDTVSAGTAWADHDGDGDLDVAVANWGGNDQDNDLYVNQSSGNWLTIALQGTRSNRQGIGAHVIVTTTTISGARTQHRWLYPKTGYASMNEPVLHFGLGGTTTVDRIQIYWPSGRFDDHGRQDANFRYRAVEGKKLKRLDLVGARPSGR